MKTNAEKVMITSIMLRKQLLSSWDHKKDKKEKYKENSWPHDKLFLSHFI